MLVDQRELEAHAIATPKFEWIAPLYSQLSNRFLARPGTAEGFPCIFAQNAFRRRNIRFALVALRRRDDPSSYDFNSLVEDLTTYLNKSAEWDGDVNTTEPLLAVFQPLRRPLSAHGYRRVADQALQALIDNDPLPWPEHTHTDPASPYWSMCFLGTQIFVNVSHPAHVNRRSRNLGESLVLVINPRERFDMVAGDNPKGNKIRQQIRSNVTEYDRIPHSPLLDHYLSGGLEWPQYMLPDDNETASRKCPLHFRRRRSQVEGHRGWSREPLHWLAKNLGIHRENRG